MSQPHGSNDDFTLRWTLIVKRRRRQQRAWGIKERNVKLKKLLLASNQVCFASVFPTAINYPNENNIIYRGGIKNCHAHLPLKLDFNFNFPKNYCSSRNLSRARSLFWNGMLIWELRLLPAHIIATTNINSILLAFTGDIFLNGLEHCDVICYFFFYFYCIKIL